MKTIILWILVLTIASVSNAQNVDIPDTAFLHALIEEGVDTNEDSLISYAEAETVTSLDVSELICGRGCEGVGEISDMTGIEAFINLDSLNFAGNKIDSIDLSMNNDLLYLNCGYNNFSNLDVSNNTALIELSCWNNQLTSLDVSNNTVLEVLYCGINPLTSLDISSNTNLIKLDCRWNQLTNLFVSNNTALTRLLCGNNQLASLNVSENTALEDLSLNYMPTLYEVCVWEGFPEGIVNSYGSPNVRFTTDCKYVDNVFIPDTAFLHALIDEGVDTNGDSLISYAEAEAVTFLDVSGESGWGCIVSRGIESLDGIEAFTNLDTLKCSCNSINNLNISNNIALIYLLCFGNQLTSLDVSNCTALMKLWCSRNQLTSLDVSNNTSLTHLYCWGNQLTNLDVSNNTALTDLNCGCYHVGCTGNQLTSLNVFNNTALEYLSCSNNQITSLDVSNNLALEYLFCEVNQLTSLDVSNNTALTYLECDGNQLTSLDVSNNVALKDLICHANQLTSLDVSNNTALEKLLCRDNQLTSLDVSNNTALEFLGISGMPTLYEVCVWKDFSPDSISVSTEGSPDVNFTTECAVNIPSEYTENSMLDIHPNPSDGIINFEIEYKNNATIEIYNVSGRLVFSKAIDSKIEKIDISGFPKGIYIVKVTQDRNLNFGKVVVR